MECVVIDAAGDGILGICDRIEILVRDDTRPEDIEYLWVVCIYEPADTAMLQEVFLFGAIPRSECAFTADGQSIILTFNPVHNGTGYDYELMDVLWNDVRVLISYEEYQIEWNPDGYLLGTGEPSTWISRRHPVGEHDVDMCRRRPAGQRIGERWRHHRGHRDIGRRIPSRC